MKFTLLTLIISMMFISPILGDNYHTLDQVDSNAVRLSQMHFGPNYCSFITDQYLFLGTGHGVTIFERGDVDSLAMISSFQTDELVIDLLLMDNLLVIAQSQEGALIVDISSISSPQIVSTIEGDNAILDAESFDGLLLLADGEAGLKVFDISIPSSPALIGSYQSSEDVLNVKTLGDIAIIAIKQTGIELIDLTNPALPTFITEYHTTYNPSSITIMDSSVYVACANRGISVVDLSDTTNIHEVSSLNPDGYNYNNLVIGDTVYMAQNGLGLLVVDFSDLSNPQVIDTLLHDPGVRNFSQHEETICVSGWSSGAYLFQVEAPAEVIQVPTGFWILDIDVHGDRMVIAQAEGGLVFCDISDLENPLPISWHFVGEYVSAAYCDDTHVWAGTGTGTVYVFSRSNQDTLELIDSIVLPGGTVNKIVGNDGLIVAISDGVHILELDVPSSITLLGSYQNGATARDIILRDQYMFVGMDGLRILDWGDPTNITEVGHLYVGVNSSLAAMDNFILIGQGYDGISVIDVTDLANPTLTTTISDNWVSDIATQSNYLFIANGPGGMLIQNMENISSPETIAFFDDNIDAQVIAVQNEIVFLSDACKGLSIIEPVDVLDVNFNSLPKTFRIDQIYPTPFNPITNIRFELALAAPVELHIYDLRGRLVHSRDMGMLQPGNHTLIWDGSDQPSGVYIVEVRSGIQNARKKVVLLK